MEAELLGMSRGEGEAVAAVVLVGGDGGARTVRKGERQRGGGAPGG